jgi:hypothetical protein
MARKPFVRCHFAWLGICLLLGVSSLEAQTEPAPEAGGGGPAAGAQPSPGGKPPATSVPRVVDAKSTEPDHPERAGLGDGLTVAVENLEVALENVEKGCEGLILFLNEIPIKGVPPDSCSLATGTVRFTLDRTDDSDQAWHSLLEEPLAFHKIISVSVGPDGDLSYPTRVKEFELEILPRLQFYGYFAGLLVFLVLLVRLARRTALLRDSTSPPPPGKLAPYSLSRFQMAFWSFLVIAAYMFIWLITGELNTITGSVLALLGIGSATALGASLIDSGKPTAEATAAGDGTPQAAPPPSAPAVSQGFLHDILSDDMGISLYRFQLFAWTLVLGVIFVASVYKGLQMPQFSTTLLGLMGISSGTYLGFKVPESRTGSQSS